jgi:DNA-binding GntR family transcriptional regulator
VSPRAATYSSEVKLSIERTSTAEHVADALREAIFGGDLRPGSPLREGAISNSVGVSRNTVREAFRLLSREGLVKHVLHHGVVVTQLSEADVDDIYAVRIVIELAALGRRSRRLSLDELAGLAEAVEELERGLGEHDWRRIVDNDFRFHRELVKLLHSPRLEQVHASALMELRLLASTFDRLYENAAQVHEHRLIYELLERNERARCRKLLEEHLSAAEVLLCRIAREGWS